MANLLFHALRSTEPEMEEVVVMECQDLEVSLADMVRVESKKCPRLKE